MHNLLSLLTWASAASAVTFYTLDLRSPGGVNITQFQGTIKIPEYPPGYPASGETYYLWPGLQGSAVSGVFQQVLEPASSPSSWGIDSGYYASSGGQPFQGGLYGLEAGDEIYFNNFDDGNGQWTTQFAHSGKPVSVTDKFPNFQGLSFNIAVWAIELYDASWNFGEFIFYDVSVTWQSSDTSACTNDNVQAYNGKFNYAVEGASASVKNGVTTCYFSEIRFTSPDS